MSFARDIRPLFRDEDVECMAYLFDLSDHSDVSEYAEAIYERVADGSMPDDEPWPEEDVALFLRWIDRGRLP